MGSRGSRDQGGYEGDDGVKGSRGDDGDEGDEERERNKKRPHPRAPRLQWLLGITARLLKIDIATRESNFATCEKWVLQERLWLHFLKQIPSIS